MLLGQQGSQGQDDQRFNKWIPKFMKLQGTQKSQKNSKNKIGLSTSQRQNLLQSRVTECGTCPTRQEHSRHRSQLPCTMGAKTTRQGKNDLSTTWRSDNVHKNEAGPFHHITKINSTRIKDVNVRAMPTRHAEENKEVNRQDLVTTPTA